jgi:Leucine Rich repeat
VHNRALVTLNLTYCKIGNAGVAVLLPPSSSITDDNNTNNTNAAEAAITTNDSLEELDLSWNGITGQNGGLSLASIVTRLLKLKHLNMTMNALSSAGAQALGPSIASHDTLQTLILSNCNLGPDGVGFLVPSSDAGRCKKNSSLQHIVLDRNGIQGELGGVNVATLVKHCCNLKKLSLQGNPLGPDGAKGFALGLLQQQDTAVPPQTNGSTGSSNNSTGADVFFESLDMSECQLGDDGVAWMATCIGRLDNCRHLNIFRNDISSHGLDVLTRHVLQVVQRLETLDVFCNPRLCQDATVMATFCDTLATMTHTPSSSTSTTTVTNTTTPCRLRQLDMRGCLTPTTTTTTTTDNEQEQEASTSRTMETEIMLLSACQQNCTLQSMSVAMSAEHRSILNDYLKRNYYLMHGLALARKAVADQKRHSHDDTATTPSAVSPQVMYWAWNQLRQRDQGASAAFDLFRTVLLCPP